MKVKYIGKNLVAMERSNQKLAKYYREELKAKPMPVMHPYQVVWVEDAARSILEVYNYDRL